MAALQLALLFCLLSSALCRFILPEEYDEDDYNPFELSTGYKTLFLSEQKDKSSCPPPIQDILPSKTLRNIREYVFCVRNEFADSSHQLHEKVKEVEDKVDEAVKTVDENTPGEIARTIDELINNINSVLSLSMLRPDEKACLKNIINSAVKVKENVGNSFLQCKSNKPEDFKKLVEGITKDATDIIAQGTYTANEVMQCLNPKWPADKQIRCAFQKIPALRYEADEVAKKIPNSINDLNKNAEDTIASIHQCSNTAVSEVKVQREELGYAARKCIYVRPNRNEVLLYR